MSLSTRMSQIREAACEVPVLGILIQAVLRGGSGHIKDMAASVAFFSFLSLFPLILGLVAVAGSVLKSDQMRDQVLVWVNEFFPVGADYVTQNIESMVRLSGAAGLASIVILFWSARKMVGAISRGINTALGQERSHAFFLSPLRNFGLVLAVSLLMFGTVALSPLADLVSGMEITLLDGYWGNVIDAIGGHLVSLASTGVMIGCAYILVPYHRPDWREVWPGLLTATLLIELGKKAFVYYVDNVSRMDALYGSISSIIVLMLWLYFFGRVLLYGADVNYVYSRSRKNSEKN